MKKHPKTSSILRALLVTILLVGGLTGFFDHQSLLAKSPKSPLLTHDSDTNQPLAPNSPNDQTEEPKESTTTSHEETTTTTEETTTTLEVIPPTPPITFEPEETTKTTAEPVQPSSTKENQTEETEETQTTRESQEEARPTTSSQSAGSLVVISKQTVSVDYLISSYLKLAQEKTRALKQAYYLISLLTRQFSFLPDANALRVLDLQVTDWWIQCLDYMIVTNNIS